MSWTTAKLNPARSANVTLERCAIGLKLSIATPQKLLAEVQCVHARIVDLAVSDDHCRFTLHEFVECGVRVDELAMYGDGLAPIGV